MWSRSRLLLITIAIAVLFLTILLAPRRSEPTYKGLTIHDWLGRYDKEAELALRILATNNFPLLTKRIVYNVQQDRL
jgi:hypothetical protein